MRFSPNGKTKVTVKSNFSKRINNRYVGHIYREVRGVNSVSPSSEGHRVSGTYFVLEETKHEGRHIASKLDDVYYTDYAINKAGRYVSDERQKFPQLRNFPYFLDEPVSPGESWRAFGEVVIDPRRDGRYTVIPIYCEYVYKGQEEYNGEMIHIVTAQYAVRYKRGEDRYGDPDLDRVMGKHVVTINISEDQGRILFTRDMVEEVYQFTDGSSMQFTGSILTWYDGVLSLDREDTEDKIVQELEDKDIEDVEVEQREEGIGITLKKIHFIPDTDTILASEKDRIDTMYSILKDIPDRTFLIIGHSADFGAPDYLMELSVKRAKKIVDELVERGISADRFLFEGRGATEPIVPNTDPESAQDNRRVEIVILED